MHECLQNLASMQSKIFLQPYYNENPQLIVDILAKSHWCKSCIPCIPSMQAEQYIHEDQNQILIKITHLRQKCMQILHNSKSILTRNHNSETNEFKSQLVIQFWMTFEPKMRANLKFESIWNGIWIKNECEPYNSNQIFIYLNQKWM